MGEYANYQGEQVKIGTCEDMYYLRADQRHLVQAVSSSLDVNGPERFAVRFRFPFPDEDGTEPGAFEHYKRGVRVPVSCAEQEHYGKCKGSSETEIVQQKYVKVGDAERLVLVCQCPDCHAAWRLQELDDAARYFHACIAESRKAAKDRNFVRADFMCETAARILAGYQSPS